MTLQDKQFIVNILIRQYWRMRKDVARASKVKESKSGGFDEYFNRKDHK